MDSRKCDELLGKIGLIREWGKANWELLIADVLEALVREATPPVMPMRDSRYDGTVPEEDLAAWEAAYKDKCGYVFPVGVGLRLIAEVRRLRAADPAQLGFDEWFERAAVPSLRDMEGQCGIKVLLANCWNQAAKSRGRAEL